LVHDGGVERCPLSRVKRTWLAPLPMSLNDPNET
jgi:hypothetical protein